MKSLCAKAMEILLEESNVQRVDAPVTVSRHYTREVQDSGAQATLHWRCSSDCDLLALQC